MTAVREAPHHDNSICVKWYDCHLPDCRDRYNARRRAMRSGIIQPRQLVDAAPVRQHILDLQEAGIGPTRVARYAGLPHTTISNFLRAQPSRGRGRKQQTTPETAAKILAVRAVTTTGTIRRIQALIAIGWPARRIAAHAGVSTRWLSELRDTTVVNIITSDKIAAAYQELRHLKPETNGVHTGHANRARQRAADNRWPTPKYWDQHADDLDDPHFIPEYRKLRAQILAEEAHWLMTAGGLDRDQAAARLGIARFTIDRALREHPQDEQELAA